MYGENFMGGFNDLKPGDHVCYLFNSREEYWAILAKFLQGGLDRNEKLLCVSDPVSIEECVLYLKNAGLDLGPVLDSHQVKLISAPALYLTGGALEPQACMARLQEEATQAGREGFSGLRFAAGTGWAAESLPNPLRLVEGECRTSDLCQRIRCTALCPYERHTTPPGMLFHVLTAHPLVMVGDQIQNNFLYLEGSAPEHDCSAAALEAGERTWRALLNASTDAAVLMDAEGTILACNETIGKRLGKSVGELIGTNMYSQLPPEVARSRKFHIDGVFRTGRPTYFEDFRADAYFEHSTYPVFDALGRVKMVASFVRDITERKHAESTLRQSAEQFRAIADSCFDWEVWRDPEGKLRWTNAAGEEITGYSALECTTMPGYPLPLVLEQDREKVAQALQSALAERTSGHEQPLRIRRKDGAIRRLLVSWKPMYDLQGTYLGLRSSCRDIGGEGPQQEPPETGPATATESVSERS
jgi:PAS domain S-box-containing protein